MSIFNNLLKLYNILYYCTIRPEKDDQDVKDLGVLQQHDPIRLILFICQFTQWVVLIYYCNNINYYRTGTHVKRIDVYVKISLIGTEDEDERYDGLRGRFRRTSYNICRGRTVLHIPIAHLIPTLNTFEFNIIALY